MAGFVRVVPQGMIHMAVFLQSLSRQLRSFHLGSLPRVAARDMREEVATEETAFYFMGGWVSVCA